MMAVCCSGVGNGSVSIIGYESKSDHTEEIFAQAQCFLSVIKKCVRDVAIFKIWYIC